MLSQLSFVKSVQSKGEQLVVSSRERCAHVHVHAHAHVHGHFTFCENSFFVVKIHFLQVPSVCGVTELQHIKELSMR